MQASPERRSSGWSPTIIAALTSAVLLCVVWQASLLVGQLQKQTAAAAVSKLVNASPGDVCINATSDTNGTKASVWFACESSEPDHFRIAATPGAVLRKQAFSPLMVSDVIYMLEHCRMLQGWYDKSVLLRFVDPTKEITGSPLNQSSMDIIAAFDNMTEATTGYITAAQGNLQLTYYNAFLDSEASNRMVSITPIKTIADYPSWRFNGTAWAEIKYSENRDFNVIELARQGWFGNATLQLSAYDPRKGVTASQYLWLNLYQDQATAKCFGSYLNDTWQRVFRDKSLYPQDQWQWYFSRTMGIDSPDDVASCIYSGRPVYLIPASFEPYSCISRIDAQKWGEWATILQAVQADKTTSFININGTFNDMYAVYTGALGALFGAFALGVCSLTCSLFLTLYRLFGSTVEHLCMQYTRQLWQHALRLGQHIWKATSAEACCANVAGRDTGQPSGDEKENA